MPPGGTFVPSDTHLASSEAPKHDSDTAPDTVSAAPDTRAARHTWPGSEWSTSTDVFGAKDIANATDDASHDVKDDTFAPGADESDLGSSGEQDSGTDVIGVGMVSNNALGAVRTVQDKGEDGESSIGSIPAGSPMLSRRLYKQRSLLGVI
jgi:hypothetical protein